MNYNICWLRRQFNWMGEHSGYDLLCSAIASDILYPIDIECRRDANFASLTKLIMTRIELRSIIPPLNFDEAGGIRIGQTRVTLDSLLAAYQAGSTPEEIAVQYPILTLAEIYAAITYYLTHPQQVEDYLEERRQMAQQQRTQIAQDNNLIGLRQRLLDRSQSKISNI